LVVDLFCFNENNFIAV